MKTKMFIDFDGTLFNTAKFRDQIFAVLRRHHIHEKDYLPIYIKECEDYHFSLNQFIENLHLAHPYFSFEPVKSEIDQLYLNAPDLLFDDSVNFLRSVDREKYSINILTLGDPFFQRTKIEHSKITQYFDEIFVCKIQKWDYLENLVESDEKFVIIDDRSDTICFVKAKFPNAVAIEIKRREEDSKDPVRMGKEYNNLEVTHFNQAFQYI